MSSTAESRIVADYFNEVFGADERLISGTIYKGTMKGSIQGHPYFSDEEWKPGSVEVNGRLFDGLLLNYDVSTNEIVMTHVTTSYTSFQISLRSSKINRIKIGTRTFIPFQPESDPSSAIYVELLADGDIQYLFSLSKTLMLTNGSGNTHYIYSEKKRQYLVYDDRVIPFRNKNTLLKLYPDLRTDLKQYARKNGLQLNPKQLTHRAIWVKYCNDLLRTQQ